MSEVVEISRPKDIINEALCCASKLSNKWVEGATFGNDNPELTFDMLRLNMYIRTLKRNRVTYVTKKEKVSIEGKFVNLSSLKKENNNLILDSKPTFTCSKVEVSPCLSDSEICEIIEQIRLLCSNCNCNCN